MEKEYREEEVPEIAQTIVEQLLSCSYDGASVLALSGDLGAGKTTLTKAIGAFLGIHEELASPTFIIMRRHETAHPVFKTLYHIDAYRLKSADEILKLGFAEILKEKDALVVVEWPELVESAIPKDAVRIEITHVSEGFRKVRIG